MRMRGIAVLVALALGTQTGLAAETPRTTTWIATNGTAEVAFDTARLAELGLSVAPRAKVRQEPPFAAHDARLHGALEFAIEHGHHAKPIGGKLRMDVPLALGKGARGTLELSLAPWDDGRKRVALVDADDRVWLTLDDVHQQFNPATGRLEMTWMDIRVGAALAQALKKPRAEGEAIGVVQLELDGGGAPASTKAVASCTSPANWPGTPGFVTDVALIEMPQLDMRCNGTSFPNQPGLCTNTGSSPDADVNLVPSVELENVGTSDVPWYDMFVFGAPNPPVVPAGYPYGATEVHPWLVWNAYRIDGDGRLQMIAASGLKHAFGTSNDNCSCPSSTRILAPMCRDTYNYGSNERNDRLGPREEIDPRTARWGRCMSTFDPDCDDDQDNNGVLPPQHRATTHESNLIAAQNPGARWFIEARYVVRDDSNTYNTMGYREFVPVWSGFWTRTFVGNYTQGPVIDAWVPAGTSTATQRNTEVTTANGRIKLAVKATDLGNGNWRYDYAIYNVDFAVVATTGSEPDLRILSNRGVLGVRFPVQAGVTTSAIESADGTEATSDDWQLVPSGNDVNFVAPAGAHLGWGLLHRFSFVANSGPVSGNATLSQNDPGGPGAFLAGTLVPGDPPEPPLFADGFE